ncbi:hypothetical protein CI102_11760 [Trichoderma harzianum]|nr:hypothetical protein CI102_11760 [Trichoderma harzianum]
MPTSLLFTSTPHLSIPILSLISVLTIFQGAARLNMSLVTCFYDMIHITACRVRRMRLLSSPGGM